MFKAIRYEIFWVVLGVFLALFMVLCLTGNNAEAGMTWHTSVQTALSEEEIEGEVNTYLDAIGDCAGTHVDMELVEGGLWVATITHLC